MARINRVFDHIEANIDRDLSLDELAGVAHFSPFHFHRIFKALVGQTLNRFVQRVRIEKAANQLIHNPKKSITEIALDCGFSGSAVFSRMFKETFKVSPSQWRSGDHLTAVREYKYKSKIGQAVGNQRKVFPKISFYIDPMTNQTKWRYIMKEADEINVEIRELPELDVAYVRHVGPYKGDSALFERLINKLCSWAVPRNLLNFPETQMLAVYHDDPNITEDDNLRVSVCITVPENTEVDGEIGKMVVPGGKFAVARFEINEDEYEEAWNSLMGGWLPSSGFQPDDRLCYEWFQNNPEEHPEKKHIFDICMPVKPL